MSEDLKSVTMRLGISGTRDGVDWPKPGGTLEVPAAEAAELIANGFAIATPATPAGDVETATADASTQEIATPDGKKSLKATNDEAKAEADAAAEEAAAAAAKAEAEAAAKAPAKK